MFEIDPAGRIEVLAELGRDFTGRLVFVDRRTAIRVDTSAVELLRLDDRGIPQRQGALHKTAFGFTPHVDFLTRDMVALTPGDGPRVVTVNLETGAFSESFLSSPEIAAAVSRTSTEVLKGRGEPLIIAATGTDGAGSLYALVFPSPREAVQLVKTDASGRDAGRLALRFPPRDGSRRATPIKLLVKDTECGVVHWDGLVDWYPA